MFMAAIVVATAAKDRIAVVQQIPGCFVLRESVAKLLRGPGGRGLLGDRHVKDSSTVMREDDQHEQQPRT
jgi:hypothetical protein